MTLDDAELRAVAEQALQEVVARVGQVEVASGSNADGHPAYFFDTAFDQDRDRARASLVRTRLRQRIRDLLLEKRDARYPYVQIHDARP